MNSMSFIEPAPRFIRGYKIQVIDPPLFHLQLSQVKKDAAKPLIPHTLRCPNGTKAHGILIDHPGAESSPAKFIPGKIQQVHRVLVSEHLKTKTCLICLF